MAVGGLVLSGLLPGAAAAPVACTIVEGAAIGAVRLGMTAAELLAVAGPPTRQQPQGPQILMMLPPPWSEAVVEGGSVRRISTRAPQCRTRSGLGPGSSLAAVRVAYAGAPASVMTPMADGDVLSYPFGGIAFEARNGRVVSVAVFQAKSLGPVQPPGPSPPAASPMPSPAATVPTQAPGPATVWNLRDLTTRVEDTSLVVAGIIENRGPPMSVYAEVTAINARGTRVGAGDGVPYPNPIAAGSPSRFEVRLAIDDVVRRVVVAVRPVGAITGALVERDMEMTNLEQFAPVALRRLTVGVEFLVNPPRLRVEARNPLSVPVAGATAVVDYRTRCFVRFPEPGRFLVDARSASVTVPAMAPGAVARVDLSLTAPTDACVDLVVISAAARLAVVRLVD